MWRIWVPKLRQGLYKRRHELLVYMDAHFSNESVTISYAKFLGAYMGNMFNMAWIEATKGESITDRH